MGKSLRMVYDDGDHLWTSSSWHLPARCIRPVQKMGHLWDNAHARYLVLLTAVISLTEIHSQVRMAVLIPVEIRQA